MMTTGDPVCAGIIFSDLVVREEGTRKLSLVGCFSSFNTTNLPFVVNPFYVTAMITNLTAEMSEFDVVANLVGPRGEAITNCAVHINFHPPNKKAVRDLLIEVVLPLGPVTLASEGKYSVKILVDKHEIAARDLMVIPVTAASQTHQEEKK